MERNGRSQHRAVYSNLELKDRDTETLYAHTDTFRDLCGQFQVIYRLLCSQRREGGERERQAPLVNVDVLK